MELAVYKIMLIVFM